MNAARKLINMGHMSSADTPQPPVSFQRFTPTHWSVVLRARERSDDALAALCASYRGPLLSWPRGRGVSSHDAEDQVQGFFAQLLKRDFLANVSQSKGRFRAFLLVSLKNYLRDEAERSSGRQTRRRPGGALLDKKPRRGSPDKRRAIPVIRRMWNSTAPRPARSSPTPCGDYRRMRARSHQQLYEALEPCLFADETAASYRQIATRLGLSEGAVKTAAHRLRDRLKNLIRDEVLQTVADETVLDEELRYQSLCSANNYVACNHLAGFPFIVIMNDAESNHCPRCGASLAAKSPAGVCTRCALELALLPTPGGQLADPLICKTFQFPAGKLPTSAATRFWA